MNSETSQIQVNDQRRRSGLDRSSCAWRDAVGPGFVVGVSGAVLQRTVDLAGLGYCR